MEGESSRRIDSMLMLVDRLVISRLTSLQPFSENLLSEELLQSDTELHGRSVSWGSSDKTCTANVSFGQVPAVEPTLL